MKVARLFFVAELTACLCLITSKAAVAYASSLSPENLGPFAVAYHDKRVPLVAVALFLAMILAARRFPPLVSYSIAAFAGAGLANTISQFAWPGTPDYIVIRQIDVIANVADLVLLACAAIVVIAAAAQLTSRISHAPDHSHVTKRR